MEKFISIVIAAIAAMTVCFAQNDKADNIVGKYSSVQGGEAYKVAVTKKSDGTYKAQIYWVAKLIDPKTGKKRLDENNPDRSLRSVPADRIVLFDGLRYDSSKQVWTDAKIYDPQRGIRASCTARFENSSVLLVRGSMFGIGETATWTRVSE